MSPSRSVGLDVMPLAHLSFQVIPDGLKRSRVAGVERLIDVSELIKLRVGEDASDPAVTEPVSSQLRDLGKLF